MKSILPLCAIAMLLFVGCNDTSHDLDMCPGESEERYISDYWDGDIDWSVSVDNYDNPFLTVTIVDVYFDAYAASVYLTYTVALSADAVPGATYESTLIFGSQYNIRVAVANCVLD